MISDNVIFNYFYQLVENKLKEQIKHKNVVQFQEKLLWIDKILLHLIFFIENKRNLPLNQIMKTCILVYFSDISY